MKPRARNTTVSLLASFLAALCAACDTGAACTVPDDPSLDIDWMRRLDCERDYQLLWDERDDAIFARTRTINWLIDREDGERVYFIDSVTWSLHYFFAAAYLDDEGKTPVGTHEEFNLLNYRREGRRFVLGKLVSYADQDILALEFSAGDTAGVELVAFAYDRVSASIYNGDTLVWRPVSARQESFAFELSGRVPTIATDQVFSGQHYQPLEEAVGYGTLRFARVAEIPSLPLAPTDIVVLDRVPNDISMVSGIITQEFQTPLSHINLLSKNRGTPNMALANAFELPSLRAFEGQLVRLVVGPQDFNITAADPTEAQDFWDGLRPSQTFAPPFDESVTGLVDLSTARADDAMSVGAKAANLGELRHVDETVPGLTIPLPEEPFAIPFAHYQAHLQSHGIDLSIADLLADIATAPLPPDQLETRLFEIRWSIYRAPVDPELVVLVLDQARVRWGPLARLRMRSSTNVEDLDTFSGAGLYTSASATLGTSEGDETAIANAIKVVWASAWNRQAFVEREFYRIEHARVRMAVLVHPAFTDELANGVALTINEFNGNRPAYYINSQVGDVSISNPTGLATAEQILYYTCYEEPEYEVITRSSLLAEPGDWPAGRAVFTDSELQELADYLGAIHAHFRALSGAGPGFAMDVEFKLAPGRLLYIKQARPLARSSR